MRDRSFTGAALERMSVFIASMNCFIDLELTNYVTNEDGDSENEALSLLSVLF
jgi:hypothetical protein